MSAVATALCRRVAAKKQRRPGRPITSNVTTHLRSQISKFHQIFSLHAILQLLKFFDTISDVPPTTAAVASSPKLLDRVRWHLRVKHYSLRTEQAYVDWIRRFILFHGKRHPNDMGEREISDFLTHLAVEKRVAASTQNQAFSAVLFLYQRVLERKLDFIDNGVRYKGCVPSSSGRG